MDKEELVRKIAKGHLNIDLLNEGKSGGEVYYEVPVWSVREALIIMYDEGKKSK